MEKNDTAVIAKLRQILTESLHIEVPLDGNGLISRGLIDSLALVELLLQIETEFDTTPDFQLLEIEDFETLESIEQFILRSKESVDTSSRTQRAFGEPLRGQM